MVFNQFGLVSCHYFVMIEVVKVVKVLIGCQGDVLEFRLVLYVIQYGVRVYPKQRSLAVGVTLLDILQSLIERVIQLLEPELVPVAPLRVDEHLPLQLPQHVDELHVLRLLRAHVHRRRVLEREPVDQLAHEVRDQEETEKDQKGLVVVVQVA